MPVVSASVESSHGFEKIRELFLHHLQQDITQSKKAVWHNLCLAKAGVEVFSGGKMRKDALHAKLRDSYDRWASLISKEDPSPGVKDVPEYVDENMFMTTDTCGLKLRDNNPKNNLALWRQWNAAKSAIVNFDNLAVKKAINRMPGKALPSSADYNLFFQHLRYELYLVRSLLARKNLGGSVAKAANTHNTEDNLSEDTSTQQQDNNDDDDQSDDINSGLELPQDNDNDEEGQSTAPKDYYPSRLLAIMVISVLSIEMEPLLGYVEDDIAGDNVADVPSRAQIRNAAALEIESPLSSSSAKTKDSSSLSHLSDRATYNDVYKEAMAAQADVGSRLAMVSEKELVLKEKEVAVHEKDVAAREKKDNLDSLSSIYDDLRKDLREAKDDDDKEEVDRLKIEIKEIKRRRIDLSDMDIPATF